MLQLIHHLLKTLHSFQLLPHFLLLLRQLFVLFGALVGDVLFEFDFGGEGGADVALLA